METTRLTSSPSRWDGRRYADNLPSASAGTPFHAPPYPGTPGITLSLAKIDPTEMQRAVEDYFGKLISIQECYPAIVLCPDAIFRESQGIQ